MFVDVESRILHRMISFEPKVYKKIVVVGDEACGKTKLLVRYTEGKWSNSDYTPTTLESYMAEVETGNTRVELGMSDTPGAEKHFSLRSVSYPDQNVVMLCFNIMDPTSLDHVLDYWLNEIQHYCPGVPILLVGLQKDGRKDRDAVHELHIKGLEPVSQRQAKKVAEKIGADYLECSAKNGKGVETVFNFAARLSLLTKTTEI